LRGVAVYIKDGLRFIKSCFETDISSTGRLKRPSIEFGHSSCCFIPYVATIPDHIFSPWSDTPR